jgi:hypothetical protein
MTVLNPSSALPAVFVSADGADFLACDEKLRTLALAVRWMDRRA